MHGIVKYVKNNKLASAAILALILLVVYPSLRPYLPYSSDGSGFYPSSEESLVGDSRLGITTQSEFKTKSGSISVDSDDAILDSESAKSQMISGGGKIDNENRYESERAITIYVNGKIPSGRFDEFFDWAKNRYDVTDFQINYETIDARSIQNEIGILLDALDTYDKMLSDAERMPTDSEKADLVFQITQRRLETLQLLRQYGYSLERLEEREEMSIIYMTFTQEKGAADNIKAGFRESWREVKDNLVAIVTDSMVILAKTVKWIVYALIIITPVYIVYRLLRRAKPSLLRFK